MGKIYIGGPCACCNPSCRLALPGNVLLTTSGIVACECLYDAGSLQSFLAVGLTGVNDAFELVWDGANNLWFLATGSFTNTVYAGEDCEGEPLSEEEVYLGFIAQCATEGGAPDTTGQYVALFLVGRFGSAPTATVFDNIYGQWVLAVNGAGSNQLACADLLNVIGDGLALVEPA